ncbi:MAG: tetratricopeptide repeat protein [Verrucomicrobiaceae bacterium]
MTSLQLSIAGALALASTFLSAQENLSPAELKIAAATKRVEASPEKADLYAPLAMAYAARARETADGEFYSAGMEAVEKALQLEPNNFPALKAEAWILLGQHEFQKALGKSRELAKRAGDDAMVHAMQTDAAIETGNYAEAETAAQWALDMDPGGAPGLTRAAYLREHYGDFDGAIDLMKKAFNRIRPAELEDRAWLLTHLGHLFLLKNELKAADAAHQEALKLFPDYHYALFNLAEVRTAQGDFDRALALHRRHFEAAPHPENQYYLAKALKRAGKDDEAAKAFAEFEKGALNESTNVDNANRELTEYYAEFAGKPAEALRIARIEMGNRQDFRTLWAYALALHANGKFSEARDQMDRALAVGVKYPAMQYHAGLIARDGGDRGAAKKFFKASLTQAPVSEVSREAREALEKLQ